MGAMAYWDGAGRKPKSWKSFPRELAATNKYRAEYPPWHIICFQTLGEHVLPPYASAGPGVRAPTLASTSPVGPRGVALAVDAGQPLPLR